MRSFSLENVMTSFRAVLGNPKLSKGFFAKATFMTKISRETIKVTLEKYLWDI